MLHLHYYFHINSCFKWSAVFLITSTSDLKTKVIRTTEKEDSASAWNAD